MFRPASPGPRRILVGGILALLTGVALLPHTRVIAETPPPQIFPDPWFKRRDYSSAEKLDIHLRKVRELNLANDEEAKDYRAAMRELEEEIRVRNTVNSLTVNTPASPAAFAALLKNCSSTQAMLRDAWGLPVRNNENAELSSKSASDLVQAAQRLRKAHAVTLPDREGKTLPPTTVRTLKELLLALEIKEANTMPAEFGPALIQLLQVEDEHNRLLLVEALRDLNGRAVSVALAQRAVFDLSPIVRKVAVKALEMRSRKEYRQVLLDSLRHPWPCVADHAAEALVALRDTDLVPVLKEMVNAPDPCAAFLPSTEAEKPMIREMVRVNHLRSCMLCHTPEGNDKRMGVFAPMPWSHLPLPMDGYASHRGFFASVQVRIEVVYLRQDFSVMQPVEKAAPWPKNQRFDFLVRTREATAAEVVTAMKLADSYPQREAVRWAIAELEKGIR